MLPLHILSRYTLHQYIQNQEEHHRKCTYEDAFIGFLKGLSSKGGRLFQLRLRVRL